jgi:hypothetical protein
VGADLGPLLNDADGQFLLGFLGHLHDTTGCREASRPTADDQNIKFHRFAFHVGLLICFIVMPTGKFLGASSYR